MNSRLVGLKAIVVATALTAVSCAANQDGIPTSSSAPSVETSMPATSTSSTAGSTLATTTTAAATTTTVSPGNALVQAVDLAGIRPEGAADEELFELGQHICGSAKQALIDGDPDWPFEETMDVGVLTAALFNSRSPERPTTAAAHFSSLAITTLCPENSPVLGADPESWDSVLEGGNAEPGVCVIGYEVLEYRDAFGGDRWFIVPCESPHRAEVVGMYVAANGQIASDEMAEVCADQYFEYAGLPDDAQRFALLSPRPYVLTASGDALAEDEGRAICLVSAHGSILEGSIAGTYPTLIEAVKAGLGLEVITCSAELFEATYNNPSSHDLALEVRYSHYWPTGLIHFVAVKLPAGETVTITEEFSGEEAGSSMDCDPATVHLALLLP